MPSIQRQIATTLKEVEKIHNLLHPLDDKDPKTRLFNARSMREDAVRVTVIQMALAIEDMLDSIFRRHFVGHTPHSKRIQRGLLVRELDDLLERRIGFEAKIKLARVLRIITRAQQNDLDRLKTLRNKCAHRWMLDRVYKRGKKPKPTKRLLEYHGGNLFDLKALERFVKEYGLIYLRLFSKYL